MKTIIKHLKIAFDLTADLVNNINENELKLKLKDIPSNTIGNQLWCIIGARESYLKAIINKEWAGFSCSLDDSTSKEQILFHLKKGDNDIFDYLNSIDLNEIQIELLLTLLEHEVSHHGQLIRYIYGNKLTFPRSWNERYKV